jgi:hypothetical protein
MESAAALDTSPDLSDFGARVQREASRRGFSQALELFPQATQILDRFHAKTSRVSGKGHLWG